MGENVNLNYSRTHRTCQQEEKNVSSKNNGVLTEGC